jgi:hypothetical protein
VIVLFGSQVVFDGRVGDSQDTLDGTQHRVVVNAYDYREVLRKRAILPGDKLSWTNDDGSTIGWEMINNSQGRPGGNLGIVRGVDQDSGSIPTFTAQLGDYIGDDITGLAQLTSIVTGATTTGFEWQITPYGVSDLRYDVWSPGMGTDNGVVLTYGDAKIANITRKVDPTTFGDCVYVTSSASTSGTKTLTPVHLEASDIASRPEGRWDLVIGTDDQTQSVLASHAQSLLDQGQVVTPSYTIQLHAGAWDGPSWLWLGDTVELRISSGRLQIDEELRVLEMSFDISPDGIETLTLTVGQLPFRLHKKIASILKRLRYLDTR